MPNLIQKVQALGADSFLALADTPASYDGNKGRFARVNNTESRLEFADPLEADGLLGRWSSGSVGNAGEFETDNTDPTLVTTISMNNTDGNANNKILDLRFLEPGDRLDIRAAIGNNEYFYFIDSINRAQVDRHIFRVTYDGGSTSGFVAGDDYDFTSAVINTINLAVVRFRPIGNAPANPVNGTVYFNGNTQKLKLYASSTWVDLNP